MIELEEAWKEGRLIEAFVSGTAVSSFGCLFTASWIGKLMENCCCGQLLMGDFATVLHHALLGDQFQRKGAGYPNG